MIDVRLSEMVESRQKISKNLEDNAFKSQDYLIVTSVVFFSTLYSEMTCTFPYGYFTRESFCEMWLNCYLPLYPRV